MLYKGIVKSNFIRFSTENTKVIDSNCLVAKRLEGFSGVYRENNVNEDEFRENYEENYEESPVSELLADRDLGEASQEDGFKEISYTKELSFSQEEYEKMKEEALEEIRIMKEEALTQIEEERKNVLSEAEERGFNEGLKKAEAQYESKFEEVKNKERALYEEYEELARELEPKMVDVITDVYKKVFGDNFYSNRDVMINLLNKALFHAGKDDEIIIHVSNQDYDMLVGRKERIFDAASYQKPPEIIADQMLLEGQAKIETPRGILDCSIDTELKELTRTLHILAYEG